MEVYQNGSTDATPLQFALQYAAMGWQVFPVHSAKDGVCTCKRGRNCAHTAKHPRCKHGFKDATTDKKKIRRWWKQWPDANVAIRTGAESNLAVIDVDGPEGRKSLVALQQELGKLPAGPVVQTSNGWHFYFQHPGGYIKSLSGHALGIDTRGDRGYVVVAPSVHESGARYAWSLSPDAAPTPVLPEEWRDWLPKGTPCHTESTESTETPENPEYSRMLRIPRMLRG